MDRYDLLRVLYAACALVTAGIALRWGGRSERAGIAIVVIASLLTVLVESFDTFSWRDGRATLVAVDLLALLAFFVLSACSRSFWPLWVTAFQTIAVATHLLVYHYPQSILQTYALLQGFWAYPIMLTIAFASLANRKRKGRRQQGSGTTTLH